MSRARPVDGHVHSEWSWDAPEGSMARSCARAVELGLPAIAFTEHLDHTVCTVAVDGLPDDHLLRKLAAPDGALTPPAFDVAGYLEAVERCRHRYQDLRVLTGLEIGEPHLHADAVGAVLAAGPFDRLLGSLHCLPLGDGFAEPPGLYAALPADQVVRAYLAELCRLVTASDCFAVVAHLDYPVRYWPEPAAGRFVLADVEEEFRQALRTVAGTGRALEVNTVRPMDAALVRWWYEEGGEAVTFGSDAHRPDDVGRGFAEAARLAESCGFRPGRDPYACWPRSGRTA